MSTFIEYFLGLLNCIVQSSLFIQQHLLFERNEKERHHKTRANEHLTDKMKRKNIKMEYGCRKAVAKGNIIANYIANWECGSKLNQRYVFHYSLLCILPWILKCCDFVNKTAFFGNIEAKRIRNADPDKTDFHRASVLFVLFLLYDIKLRTTVTLLHLIYFTIFYQNRNLLLFVLWINQNMLA